MTSIVFLKNFVDRQKKCYDAQNRGGTTCQRNGRATFVFNDGRLLTVALQREQRVGQRNEPITISNGSRTFDDV